MPDIYDQHQAAFRHVSAYVVAKGDDRVASVAFKFSPNGTGRVTCYLHIFGAQMVRAYASGGDYDKQSAAMHSALSRIKAEPGDIRTIQAVGAFRDAVTDNGQSWDNALRRAGFNVWQAV